MKKRIVRTGLVGSLKDDFEGAGAAFETNLKRRMRMLCSRPGPRYDPEAKLDLSIINKVPGAGIWKFDLSDVGVVVFDDYDFWCPETLVTLSHLITVPPQGLHYVIIRKVVTDSVAGTFMPGYPDESDSYTEQEVSVRVDVAQKYERGPDAIPVYCVSFDGTAFTIEEDYRTDVCLILNSDISLTESDMTIESVSVSVQDLSDLQVALQPEAEGGGVLLSSFNLESHPRNPLRNASFLDIIWPTVERDMVVWAYHVKITPYAGATLDVNKAFHTMVLGQPGQYYASYQHPIIRGTKYNVAIRALSSSLARVIGPWKETIGGIYVDVSPVLPKPPTPVLTVYGINPRTYLWTPIGDEPAGLESVCFKRVWRNNEEIVYEGGYRSVVLEAAPLDPSVFYIKYKYKNNTLSPWSDGVSVLGTDGGVEGSSSSQHLTLVIPVDALMTESMHLDQGEPTIAKIGTIKIPKNSPSGSLVGKITEARIHMLGLGNVGVSQTPCPLSMELMMNQSGVVTSLMQWDKDDHGGDVFDMPTFSTSPTNPAYTASFEKTGLEVIVTPGETVEIYISFESDDSYGSSGHLLCGILMLEMQASLPGVGGIE
ncbi:MAG: hypothetical protein WC455_09645 [Dehalococcoidia bacterium]|jgi:hypothetical protein